MRVLGMMSGTSHDAIEVAVADLTLVGSEVRADLVGSLSVDFPAELRAEVVRALPPQPTSMEAVCRLDTRLGQAFAAAAEAGAEALGPVDLVVSHGQTMFHWVDGQHAHGTLQLGDPVWIAERVGAPVVSGLRGRDVAAGGQGAPLVSILDVLLLTDTENRRGSLNLGGIANLTVVDADTPVAFDVGPANALLDAAVVELTGGRQTYDADGAWAAQGSVDDALLAHLLAEPYYGLPAPKSTGKEIFSSDYLARQGIRPDAHPPADLLATLTALTAQTVVDAAHSYEVSEVVMAGGGTRNRTLVRELRGRGGDVAFDVIDAFGIPSSAKEAYAFALLGFLTWHGLPATIPSCTGARHGSVLGSVTPGSRPLAPPPPATVAPRRFVVTTPDPMLAGGRAAAGGPVPLGDSA